MPEPWTSKDEMDTMDDVQIRGYVRYIMKHRARREITDAMSDWGIHESKHAQDLWSSFKQVEEWVSPQDWKLILSSHEAWDEVISGTVAVMRAHFQAFLGKGSLH